MSAPNEEYKVDRTGWPSGPWDDEPDKLQWRTAAGLPALIVRNDMGALCGYVGLPAGHPARSTALNCRDDEIPGVSVHGGITYGGKCQGHICHVPEPGETDDVYWLGFDTAHAGDYWPGRGRWLGIVNGIHGVDLREPLVGERYRGVDFVRAECERLAAQLEALVLL